MEELLIREIRGNEFRVIHCDTYKTYNIRMTFYDLEQPLKAGDTIFMHKELLDPKSQNYFFEYYFGALDKPYGKQVTSLDDIDAIKIVTEEDKEIILKRFYG